MSKYFKLLRYKQNKKQTTFQLSASLILYCEYVYDGFRVAFVAPHGNPFKEPL